MEKMEIVVKNTYIKAVASLAIGLSESPAETIALLCGALIMIHEKINPNENMEMFIDIVTQILSSCSEPTSSNEVVGHA
jgi:hypothetical protein